MIFDFALLSAGSISQDNPFEFHDASSSFCRFIYVEQGRGTVYCGNERHTIQPGHIYFVPPLLSHSVQTEGATRLTYVHFTDQTMAIYDHFHQYRYNLEITAPEPILQIIRQIQLSAPHFTVSSLTPSSYDSPHHNMRRIKQFLQLPPASRMLINGMLHVLLSFFMDQDAPAASVNDMRISKAIWTINRDLSQVPSLDELSQQACLNKNSFIRLFRQQTGLTPIDYVIHRRIMRAQILFVSGNRSVKEVAHQVGYDNISYFGRTFKRITGIGPLDFIRQNNE